MINLVKSFFILLSQVISILEKAVEKKKILQNNRNRAKANAYDKLNKTVAARRRVNERDADANLMSDDGYKRK